MAIHRKPEHLKWHIQVIGWGLYKWWFKMIRQVRMTNINVRVARSRSAEYIREEAPAD